VSFAELSSQRAVSTSGGFAATKVASTPGSVTAGNFIVAGGAHEQGTFPSLVISAGAAADGVGWRDVRSRRAVNGNVFSHISWAQILTAGACTVTRTMKDTAGGAVGAYGSFSITEFSGTPYEVTSSDELGTSTSPAPGSVPVLTGDLLLGVVTYRVGGTTCTQPSGWSLIGEQEAYGADQPHHFAFKVALANGTETPVWTLSSSGIWLAQVVVLRPLSAAVPSYARSRVVNQ